MTTTAINNKGVTVGQMLLMKEDFSKKFASKQDLSGLTSGNGEDIDRILLSGFANGQKHFSDDGMVITTTDALGRTLTKTFSDDFLTCTVVLSDPAGDVIATLVKTFSADGKNIESAVTYAG